MSSFQVLIPTASTRHIGKSLCKDAHTAFVLETSLFHIPYRQQEDKYENILQDLNIHLPQWLL